MDSEVAEEGGEPGAAMRACRDMLARIEDVGVSGCAARAIFVQARGCGSRLQDMLDAHLRERGEDEREGAGAAAPCVVCQEELPAPAPPGEGGEAPAAAGSCAPPAAVHFDCGHRLCLECATGMLRAKRDDADDAVNLLECPCERLEGCGGALFLSETERVLAALAPGAGGEKQSGEREAGEASALPAAAPREPALARAKGPAGGGGGGGGGAEMEVDTGAQELPGIQPPSAVPPTLQRQCLCELHRALAGVEWGARVHP